MITIQPQSMIERLVDVGYSYEEAKNLYSLYEQKNKLLELESYIQIKEATLGV